MSHCTEINDKDFVPILEGLQKQKEVINECIVSSGAGSTTKSDGKPDIKKEKGGSPSISPRDFETLKNQNKRYKEKMHKILEKEEAAPEAGISKLLSEDKKLHKSKKELGSIKLSSNPKRKITDALIEENAETASHFESETGFQREAVELKGLDELQELVSEKQLRKRRIDSRTESGTDIGTDGRTGSTELTCKPAILYSQAAPVKVKSSSRREPVTLYSLLQLDLKLALEDDVLLLEKLLTHYDLSGTAKSEHDEFAGAQALFGICARLMELLMQLQSNYQSGLRAVPEELAKKFRDVAAHGVNIFSDSKISPVDFESLKILTSLILTFLRSEKDKAAPSMLKQSSELIIGVLMSERMKPFMQHQIEQAPNREECLKQIRKGEADLVRIATQCDFTPIEIKVLAEWTTYGRLGVFAREIKAHFRDVYKAKASLYDEYIKRGIDFRHVKSSIQEKIGTEVQAIDKPKKSAAKKFV